MTVTKYPGGVVTGDKTVPKYSGGVVTGDKTVPKYSEGVVTGDKTVPKYSGKLLPVIRQYLMTRRELLLVI